MHTLSCLSHLLMHLLHTSFCSLCAHTLAYSVVHHPSPPPLTITPHHHPHHHPFTTTPHYHPSPPPLTTSPHNHPSPPPSPPPIHHHPSLPPLTTTPHHLPSQSPLTTTLTTTHSPTPLTTTPHHLLATTHALLQYTKPEQVTERAPSGCYVSGMYLEGGCWDHTNMCLRKSPPKVLIEELPILRVIPIEASRLKLQVRL